MRNNYLEATFRRGRLMAAYLYLPRDPGARSTRTKRFESGLLVDFDEQGRPIGIEITAPNQISAVAVNQLLADLGLSPMPESHLAPLQAA